MSISEKQLKTWSHQGAVKQSKDTYQHIKKVLESKDTPFAHRDFSVFLQGSYKNDTNIYAESDVDIVIELKSVFQSGLDAISDEEKRRYWDTYSNASYTHKQFRSEVLGVLKEAYSANVKNGSKAIFVEKSASRRKADVLVALQYRKYKYFWSHQNSCYIGGIFFYNSRETPIINYPRQHSDNLTAKHQTSQQWLKPTVRIFKNLREKLISERYISSDIAPSYFLEGLLYNVPDRKFRATYQDTFLNALMWLRDQQNWDTLVCANEQHNLFSGGSNTSWSRNYCDKFIKAALKYWRSS